MQKKNGNVIVVIQEFTEKGTVTIAFMKISA